MHDDRQFCLNFTRMDFCWCKEVALPDMQKKRISKLYQKCQNMSNF